MIDDTSCGLCRRFVGFAQREMFFDHKTRKPLHQHCCGAIKKGLYKWNRKLKKYEKVSK